jgi:hypothetical protein
MERSIRAADLVIMAKDGRLARPASRPVLWKFRVTDLLKGAGGPSEIRVNLGKAPVGLWPRKGESTILCLSWSKGGVYHLASYYRSILTPDMAQAVRAVVAAAKAAKAAGTGSQGTDTTTSGGTSTASVTSVQPPSNSAVKLMKRRIAGADTILVGALSGVRPSRGGVRGIFKVEESLLGYGGFVEPIRVRIKGSSRPAGRYILFLRGSLSDATFSTLTRDDAVRIIDDAAGRTIKGAAWNARDLKRCIRCYSGASNLRMQYDSGEEGRKMLEQQLASFPGKVSLTLRRISLSPRPGVRAADATVLLKLTASGMEDRRTATMQLVHENGEWLVLNEGF